MTNVAPVQDPPKARVRVTEPEFLSDISEASEWSSDGEGSVRESPEDRALDPEPLEEE